MCRRGFCSFMVLALTSAVALEAKADLSIVGGTGVSTYARTGTGSPSSQHNAGNSSFSHTATHGPGGESRATTGFTLTTSSLKFDFDQVRSGLYGSLAQVTGNLQFSVSQNARYLLSGFYNLVGDRAFYMSVGLYDVTTPQTLFRNVQHSQSTPNAQFVLGNTGGDQPPVLEGLLSDTLVTGHLYELQFNFYSNGVPTAGLDSTALGNLNLSLVPAPDAGMLGLLGLGALAIMRRRSGT